VVLKVCKLGWESLPAVVDWDYKMQFIKLQSFRQFLTHMLPLPYHNPLSLKPAPRERLKNTKVL